MLPNMREASPERKSSLSKYVLRQRCFAELSSKARSELAGIKFVPVRGTGGVFAAPTEIVDPVSHVSKLYFEDECVFPEETYLTEFGASLKELGMIKRLTGKILLERIEIYSEGRREIDEISEKVQHLLTSESRPPKLDSEHCQMRWIPASIDGVKKLYNATECRSSTHKALVEYSMPITELEFSLNWQKRLGWDAPPARHYILRQLDEAVSRQDQDTSVILSLLSAGWLSEIQELDTRAWIPGVSGGYYRRSDVFFKSAGLHPYIDNLNSQFTKYFRHSSVPIFGIQQEPSFEKVCDVPAAGRGCDTEIA